MPFIAALEPQIALCFSKQSLYALQAASTSFRVIVTMIFFLLGFSKKLQIAFSRLQSDGLPAQSRLSLHRANVRPHLCRLLRCALQKPNQTRPLIFQKLHNLGFHFKRVAGRLRSGLAWHHFTSI